MKENTPLFTFYLQLICAILFSMNRFEYCTFFWVGGGGGGTKQNFDTTFILHDNAT